MVSNPRLVYVFVLHRFAGNGFDEFEGFQDGDAVLAAATNVIHFTTARCGNEAFHESNNVMAVDVIPDLFSFITKDTIDFALQVALNEIA